MATKDLCGFNALRPRSGYEIMGAAKKPTGKGKSISRPGLVREGASAHQTIVAVLRKVAAQNPGVSKFKTVVHGVVLGHSVFVVGASDPIITKKLGPKAQAALDRYNKAATISQDNAKASSRSLSNAIQKASILKKAVDASANNHVVLQAKRVVMVGADPDPNNPGFLTDGTPDPNYQGPSATTQQVANIVQSQPVPLTQAPKKVLDGIVYDGSAKGWPNLSFGSYSSFFGPQDQDSNGAWGVLWAALGGNLQWTLRLGHGRTGNVNWGPIPGAAGDPAAVSAVSSVSLRGDGQAGADGGWGIHEGNWASYNGPVYGPLIGNPKSDFANLRWATEDMKWFWFPTEAPDWATIDIRNEQALIQKAADDAAAAAQKAAADAAAKTAADQAAQQAQLDFQSQLAQQQQAQAQQAADAAAQVAATAQQTADAATASEQAKAQADADLAAQKAADAQAAAEAAANLQIAQQQAQLQLDQQRAALEQQKAYAAAHPDEAPQAPQDQGDGDQSDQGIDDGSDQGGGYAPAGGWDTSFPPSEEG